MTGWRLQLPSWALTGAIVCSVFGCMLELPTIVTALTFYSILPTAMLLCSAHTPLGRFGLVVVAFFHVFLAVVMIIVAFRKIREGYYLDHYSFPEKGWCLLPCSIPYETMNFFLFTASALHIVAAAYTVYVPVPALERPKGLFWRIFVIGCSAVPLQIAFLRMHPNVWALNTLPVAVLAYSLQRPCRRWVTVSVGLYEMEVGFLALFVFLPNAKNELAKDELAYFYAMYEVSPFYTMNGICLVLSGVFALFIPWDHRLDLHDGQETGRQKEDFTQNSRNAQPSVGFCAFSGHPMRNSAIGLALFGSLLQLYIGGGVIEMIYSLVPTVILICSTCSPLGRCGLRTTAFMSLFMGAKSFALALILFLPACNANSSCHQTPLVLKLLCPALMLLSGVVTLYIPLPEGASTNGSFRHKLSVSLATSSFALTAVMMSPLVTCLALPPVAILVRSTWVPVGRCTIEYTAGYLMVGAVGLVLYGHFGDSEFGDEFILGFLWLGVGLLAHFIPNLGGHIYSAVSASESDDLTVMTEMVILEDQLTKNSIGLDSIMGTSVEWDQ